MKRAGRKGTADHLDALIREAEPTSQAVLGGALAGLGHLRAPSSAVLTIAKITGPPEQLLAAYDRYRTEKGAVPDGVLLQLAASTHDGIVLIDVWASRKAFDDWMDASPEASTPKVYSLHALRSV
jgi:hypothetical protein